MSRSRLLGLLCAATVAAGVLHAAPAPAKPFVPSNAPVHRVIDNIEAYLRDHPNDEIAYYTLGRAHYAALYDLAVLPDIAERAGGSDSPPALPLYLGLRYPGRTSSVGTIDADRIAHAKSAVKALQRAIQLSKGADRALPLLTLASVAEAVAGHDSDLGAPPSVLGRRARSWRDAASTAYLRAYDLGVKNDLAIKSQPLFGLETLVAYEAGDSYLRLNPRSPRRAEIRRSLRRLEGKPPGPVTPLIFSTSPDVDPSLADLVDTTIRVTFDIDGTGRQLTIPWVRPETALLVWDPTRSGVITSGRQLFGTPTWWMLWPDAYRALDALDDDRDGWLRGGELAGLSIWRDRNQNAVSDPGEVTPLELTEIMALSARATERAEGVLVSRGGVVFRDARSGSTYDWVVTPQRPGA